MVTRTRNLTNTSNASNSTNYSSIEQLYEITTIPNTFDITNNNINNRNNISISPKHISSDNNNTNMAISNPKLSNVHNSSECKPLKSIATVITKTDTNISTTTNPTIGLSALSKLSQNKLPQKHLPIPSNVSRSKSLNSKRTSHSTSYASQNKIIRNNKF